MASCRVEPGDVFLECGCPMPTRAVSGVVRPIYGSGNQSNESVRQRLEARGTEPAGGPPATRRSRRRRLDHACSSPDTCCRSTGLQ
jgi:hypothetical protein